METKLAALLALCFFLRLRAGSAQNKPPLKEIEMPPRKVFLQSAAPVPVSARNGATEDRSRSPVEGSLASRLVMIAGLSLCVTVVSILCRLCCRDPQTQSAELANAGTVRPSITYNFIGSCFSLN